jgi:hypothetical protein
MRVDPRAEFRQMFDEGWRFQRDFLYVDNLHGADYERRRRSTRRSSSTSRTAPT